MTYREGRCSANCSFCPQARESNAEKEKLSRVSWPKCNFEDFLEGLNENQGELERICIQTINRPGILNDVLELTRGISKVSNLPISVSYYPKNENSLNKLARAGVDRISVPIDGATEQIFNKVKGPAAGGPYKWEKHLQALERAKEVFDDGVSTHLIIGLGETEQEAVELIQFLYDKKILVGLFAFTPIPGTVLSEESRPSIASYRRIQLARHLIVNNLVNYSGIEFENGCIQDFGISQTKITELINTGKPFLTSGCPGCNRPFYNESPSGPIYNYPEDLSNQEIERVKTELESF